ncbi:hypothetical protein RB195_004529 [Necator americanus]|uniref:HORMA domain-containing protein n=1 Tax=Necator americanus TaxID=51031 RepID=A0ABR1BIF5_NECAM
MSTMPKTIDVGNVPRKILVEVCEDVSEFLVIMAHTVLYRFGGYSPGEFREYSYGGVVTAKTCLDERVIRYCQRSAHLANQAMQKHNLEKYEVSIEDRTGEALISFRVEFRRTPTFYNRTIKNLAEPELCRLRHNLAETLLQLQSVKISDELQDRLENTPTRLRIRLQLCNKQPKRLFKITAEPILPGILVPWSDPVRNEYNQLIFAAFVPADHPSTSQRPWISHNT